MILLIQALILLSFAQANTDCDGVPKSRSQSGVVEAANDCAPDLDKKTNLSEFLNADKKEFCNCLEKAKFNHASTPFLRKKSFNKFEYDYSIQRKLSYSFKDLVGNFTKFNNLLLSKNHLGNLFNDNPQFCTIKSLVDDLKKLQYDSSCKPPPGFFMVRVAGIFGTTNIDSIPNDVAKMSQGISEKSCVSSAQYLNLRSANGTASTGFRYWDKAQDEEAFKSNFLNPEKPEYRGPLKDLLSYDVLFNLAYRDKKFGDYIHNRVFVDKTLNQYDMYRDDEVLKEAYASLNKTCINFSNTIKKYMCSDEYPKFKPAALNMHLNDYLQDKDKDPAARKAMRDYFTWDFACNENKRAKTGIQVLNIRKDNKERDSKEEEDLSNDIQESILLKSVTKNVFSTDDKSDFSQFNSMFCKGREGTQISNGDLPAMLKDFIKSKSSTLDIQAVFNSTEIGLKMDMEKDPMFALTKPEDIEAGKLPKINQIKWEEMVAPKLVGLTPDEKSQLYAIIEMQTNRRFTEIEDLKIKLGDDYKSVTYVELDAITRGNKEVEAKVKARLAAANSPTSQNGADPIAAIKTRYSAIQADETRNENRVQDILLSRTTPDKVKAEAQTYNSNNGSYQAPSSGQNFVGNTNAPATGTTTQTVTNPGTNTGVQNISRNVASTATSTESIPSSTTSSISSSTNTNKSSFSSPSFTESTPVTPRDRSDTGTKTTKSDSRTRAFQDEVNRIKDEISKSQQDFNVASRAFKNQTRLNDLTSPTSQSASLGGSGSNSQFAFPKNLPVKTANGDYYYPQTSGSELSSKKGKDTAESASKVAGASMGGAPGASASANTPAEAANEGIGGVDMNALAGIGGDIALKDTGRGPASIYESVEDIKKRMKLSAFEYHKYIPHAIFDVVGAVDKVVILLGLEGKTFKTIEAQEVVDKITKKLVIKYTQRTYDFVPEGEFEEFKELFSNSKGREKAFLAYFNFPRNKDNLVISKKYAKATKEVAKESLTHNFVLSIQNDIMSEDEIRKTINGAMELLK